MRRTIVERARGPVQRMCYSGMPMPPPPGMVPYPPDMSYVPPPPKPAKHANEYIKKTPLNFGVCVVPQGELWVAERFGKYHRTVEPGLNFLVPGIDRISYVYNSKEQAHEIPDQAAITKDNVIINIDGILFMKIINAKNASYNIDNPIYNLINVAQTAMRSEIGKLSLDKLFEERSSLNEHIKAAILKDSEGWGVECRRYEIKDIQVSDIVRKSMDLQAEADRIKRKNILESEGDRDAMTNRAMGHKQSLELMAEGKRIEAVKAAQAAAQSTRFAAEAQADAIRLVSESIGENTRATEAMNLEVTKNYLQSFGNIAKECNTVVLPANMQDPSAMIGSAMSVYSAVTKNQANAGRAASTSTSGSTEATATASDPFAAAATLSSPQDATRSSPLPPLGDAYGAAPTPTMPPPPFPFPHPVPPTA